MTDNLYRQGIRLRNALGATRLQGFVITSIEVKGKVVQNEQLGWWWNQPDPLLGKG